MDRNDFDRKVTVKTAARGVFQSMNFGTYEGYTIDDTVKPYTVYRKNKER
jgi:hypothetical protein